MKKIILSVFIIFSLLIYGCAPKAPNDIKENKDIPKYSEVTAVELKDEKSVIYKINKDGVYKIGVLNGFIEMKYNLAKEVSAYNIGVKRGENLSNTKLVVNKAGKEKEFTNFYTFLDLAISRDGSKIAFRAFLQDSLDSAEGLKIINTDSFQLEEFKSEVLVSGSQYKWLDNEKLLYYGSILSKKNSNNIYIYDFKTKEEKVFYDKVNSYCTFFEYEKGSLIFVDKGGLNYYNMESNGKNLDPSITGVYSATIDKNKNLMYIIAKSDITKKADLYKIDLNNKSLTRLTYDFPKNIDSDSRVAIDKDGIVYFVGSEVELDSKDRDIYTFNPAGNSISLISTHQGQYKLYMDSNK